MIDSELQQRLQTYAVDFLKRGRAKFDVPHSEAVAYYALLIAAEERLDELSMFTAAWLHDVGYADLFDGLDSHDLKAIKSRKPLHMVVGSQRAAHFIALPENQPFYADDQAKRVPQLVLVHDKVEQLASPYEIALGVADTLGAIDVRRVTPTFSYADYREYLSRGLRKRKELLFQTDFTRQLFREVLQLFIAHYENARK